MLSLIGIFYFLSVVENFDFVQADAASVAVKCYEPNEFYSCGGACQNSCVYLITQCPIINIRCNDQCYCIPGFARDDRFDPSNTVCIPEWECFSRSKPICLGDNEEFLTEASSCQKKCSRLGIQCPIVNKKGIPGCHCIEGYARNTFGTCIPVNECPKERCPKDMHEVFTESRCDTTCLNLGICSMTDPPPPLVKRCYCEIGYFRATEGTCVQQYQCPVQGSSGAVAEA